MGLDGLYVIVIVGCGLSLQAVSSIGKDEPITPLALHTLTVGVEGGETARSGLASQEIIGKKGSMYIACVKPPERDGVLTGGKGYGTQYHIQQ